MDLDQPPTTTTLMLLKNNVDRLELPNEILKKILDQLRINENEFGAPASDEEIQALLRFRKVNPNWKDWMEEALENRCLDFWRKWNPTEHPTTENPYAFPSLRVSSRRYKAPNLQEHPCPKIVSKKKSKNYNPFPSKSVRITQGDRIKKETKNRLNQCELFVKWGHHLTSLTISTIKNFHAITLVQIVKCTPNLKAIALQDMKLRFPSLRSQVQIRFPKLKKLEHVRVFTWNNAAYNKIYKAILEPHQEQLLSIQMSYDAGKKKSSKLLNFPNLKWLKIWDPDEEFFTNSVALPNLQRVSLGCISVDGDPSLRQIFTFFTRLPPDLVDVYLGINGYASDEIKNYSEKNPRNDVDFCKLIPKFLKVTTFTTFYPTCEFENLVVKDFFQMFPNLETLKLMRYEGRGTLSEIPPKDFEAVQNHLTKEQYWNICTSLKTIEVYKGPYENEPFYTEKLSY